MPETETAMPDTAQNPPPMDYEVLICTYNGASFILEQVYSILSQEPAPQRILVSDDGSSDATLDILEQIAHTSDVPIEIVEGPGRGVVANVLSALPQTRADYVFLADQDDIWLDEKVALFCARMRSTTEPHLIFSDAWVWHPEREQRHSFWKLDRLLPANARNPRKLAFYNTVQGASACVNRALIERLNTDPRIVMHDWWLALIASSLGQVSVIDQPTMLYRQHGQNQIGCQQKDRRRKNRDWAERKKTIRRIMAQALAFSEHYGEQLDARHQGFFRAYRSAQHGNLIKRGLFILRYWPRHRDLRHTLVLWGSIVLFGGPKLGGTKPGGKSTE